MNWRALHKRWMVAEAVHAAIIAEVPVTGTAMGHVRTCAVRTAGVFVLAHVLDVAHLLQASKIKKSRGREGWNIYLNWKVLHKRWMVAEAVHAAIIAKMIVVVAAVEIALKYTVGVVAHT